MNLIQKSILFEKLWAMWPRQEGKPAAKKGFDVALNEKGDVDPKRLKMTVEIYLAELKDVKYCHSFGNYFRNHHYLETYEEFNGIEKYKSQLDLAEKSAREIIDSWNASCKNHWSKVENIKDRTTLVKDALYNEFFKNNWKRALKRCEEIFDEKFEAGDWRRKTKPSIAWFCNVHYDSHTVARIIEGEFGSATPKEEERIIPEVINPATEDEIEAFFKDL